MLAPPALAAAWFGWPWLPAMAAVAAAGMGVEWARLANGGARTRAGALIAATPLAAVAVAGFGQPAAGIAVAAAGTLLALLALWPHSWARGKARNRVVPAWAGGGTLYIALACVAFVWLASSGGRATVVWLLVLVWAVDIAAYAVGHAIGGAKLAPVISPNKTWAGFAGGLAGAALVGWAAAALIGDPSPVLTLASLVLGLAAQLGDLAESAAKRHFRVKDTGALIPGHGGLLDRLDSLLAASLALAVLTLMTGGPLLITIR